MTDAGFDVDLFVLGGGSGGVRAARVAANHGARVAIAEERRWGGTCVIRGCVPKKLMVYAAEVSAMLEDARGFGWAIDGARHDWPTLIAAKDKEIARLSELYVGNLRRLGVAIHDGRARLVDAHTVDVAGQRVRAANILVATGGAPRLLAVPGGDLAVTSDEVFHLPALPPRVLVVGGGYIGVEFAHIFAGLGARVAIAHRADRVLPGFDGELRAEVETGLTGHGIEVAAGAEVASIARVAGGLAATLTTGAVLEVDLVMAAVGRAPSTAGLGLEAIGVALDARGAIVVDELSRTRVPHVYAVGDVTGRVALTPIAIREGHAFADTVFGGRPTPIVHHHIPTAVFSQPPAAAVGLGEEVARAAGHDVQVYRARFRPMRHTISGRQQQVLIKLVVDAASRKVLGVHMVGPDAPEIIQAAAIAVTMGATKEDFDRTFAIHPTTAEELVLLR
ncbi:MAG TPA: glutathione-disulfide reductase [Kofleriaceae bacterium]|nr:glutathione-disulfide reductase [Kofleriaceae bacterium]